MSVEEPETPGWDGIIRVAIQGALAGVRTTLPGKITSYDAVKQMASVLPLTQEIEVLEGGASRSVNLPEIHSVPVMHLGPTKGRITFPVAVGDICILWFSSSSLDQWILRASDKPVDPKDSRRHDLNDAIAMVGLHTPASPLTTAPADAVVVHCGAGVVAKIGGPTGTQKTLMADLLKTAIDALTAGIRAGLVAAGNTSTGGTAIGVAFDTVLSAFDTAYAAAKTTKAEVK